MKVKCIGYKRSERFFTLGKEYEWKDNTMTNDNGYTYHDCMVKGNDPSKWELSYWYTFEVVETPVTIVEHLIRGKKTIVKLSNGKVGIANCSPEDEFDIATGAAIALGRAYGKNPRLERTVSAVKEVKRKAKIGEYIRITHPAFRFDKVGDIFKVTALPGGVHWKDYPKDRKVDKPYDRDYWLHLEEEYVVLEGYKPPVEETPKFEVGQLVRIKSWDEMEKEFGLTCNGHIDINRPIVGMVFHTSMGPLCGKFAEITKINGNYVNLRFFNVARVNTGWNYTTDMIKAIKED